MERNPNAFPTGDSNPYAFDFHVAASSLDVPTGEGRMYVSRMIQPCPLPSLPLTTCETLCGLGWGLLFFKLGRAKVKVYCLPRNRSLLHPPGL